MAKSIKTFLTFQEHQLPKCFRNWVIEENDEMATHPVSTEKYVLVSPVNLQGNKEFLEYVEKMSLEELFQMIVNLGRVQLWKALDKWMEYNTPGLNEQGNVVYTKVVAPDLGIVDKVPVGLNIWERYAIERSVLDYLISKYTELTAGSAEFALANYLHASIGYAQMRMTAGGVGKPKAEFINIITHNKVQPLPMSEIETVAEGLEEEVAKELMDRLISNLEACGFTIERPEVKEE